MAKKKGLTSTRRLPRQHPQRLNCRTYRTTIDVRHPASSAFSVREDDQAQLCSYACDNSQGSTDPPFMRDDICILII